MAAELTGVSSPSKEIGLRPTGAYRLFRRWPIIPVFLLTLVLFSGIAAPLIAPHDPNLQSLTERKAPPFWYGAKTELATFEVVQRMLPGQDDQISLAEAQEYNPNVQIGDSIEVEKVIRSGGTSKFCSVPASWAGTSCPGSFMALESR